MKKHLVTLFVFIYIAAFFFSALTGVVTRAEELPETNSTEDTTLPQTEPSAEEGISALLDMEAKEPKWMPYEDFFKAQNKRIMEDPSILMGCVVQFSNYWQTVDLSSDPTTNKSSRGNSSVSTLVDENGNKYLLKIVDYAFDSAGQLWYKIESADDRILPEVLIETPYVMQLDYVSSAPSLIALPLQATFVGETVVLKNDAAGATPYITVSTADLPEVFDVIPVVDSFYTWYYDLGDISGWADGSYANYHYVDDESAMILIPPEVTLAVDKLLNAGSVPEFEEIWATIPDSVKDLIVPSQMEQLENLYNSFEPITYETAVMVGEIAVPVTVTGHIPENGITLSATLVSNEQVIEEGFDVKPDASDVITALDIKLLKEDGTEWQPQNGEWVEVSIGVGALGIPDETVVRLHHKHEDEIYVFEIFLVLDGKVTLRTTGFSTYVVSATNSATQTGASYEPDSTIELTVGQTIILYATPSRLGNNNRVGTWEVTDTSGALFYTVYSSDTPNHSRGMYVPWIQITALKEATGVTIAFKSANITYNANNQGENPQNASTETYKLNVVPPKANDGRALYLKDDVNATGRIIATLVDGNGNEIPNGLDGAVFTWTRSDQLLISPNSYGDNYRSVNIAKDHSGLVEARKTNNVYNPITYTVDATLSDGTTETATYKVLYQSEFLNSVFEVPKMSSNTNYCYFPNGWEGLYWKTSAPGTGANLMRDIEFGAVNGANTTGFGVPQAADKADGGTQFAELNAEEFGALYQDIISVPGEDIEWSFRHAPRQKQSWIGANSTIGNKMYIVVGATEEAQKLTTQAQLEALGTLAKETASAKGNEFNTQFLNGQVPVEITYNEADYYVWYHDAGAPGTNDNSYYTAAKDYGWTLLAGSYRVPDNQYRTRLFFVTDSTGNDNKNFGNLIDATRAGQYKTYLIEYYEETYISGQSSTLVHLNSYDESGEDLIYSFVKLGKLDSLLSTSGDFLHKIMINGSNYPYSIRYIEKDANGKDKEVAYLYIEKYPGKAKHFDNVANTIENSGYYDSTYEPNNYDNYDIVMQIVLRDTVVGVQKKLQFPSTLTTEQKLKIMTDLVKATDDPNDPNDPFGYEARFTLVPSGTNTVTNPTNSAYVTSRDPQGEYTAYVSVGDDPDLGTYRLQEVYTTPLVGLELDFVEFSTSLYKYGEQMEPEFITHTVTPATADKLLSQPFTLTETYKIADVVVTNIYREKITKVYYEAVGKGKVQLTTGGDFEDRPWEELEFYSGDAEGAVAKPGKDATFVGWFTDPSCSEESRVTAVNGVYDKAAKTFVPNTNIIEADEVTFYALFVTGSIEITRTNGEPNETFVYLVTRSHGGTTESFYVTVKCDGEGKGRTEIFEVGPGTYTVQELGDWTWRHNGSSQSKSHTGTGKQTFAFTSEVTEQYWLSGWSNLLKNIFKNGIIDIPEEEPTT